MNGKAQEHVYAIARLAGIEPTETPLLMLHVEGNQITIHYVKDGVGYQHFSDYFV
jgi:hypothetical protein